MNVNGYRQLANLCNYSYIDGSFDSWLDPGSIFWKCMEFWFKANQLGILDPESFYLTYESWLAKLCNGETYVGYWNYSFPNRAVCGETAYPVLLPGAFPYLGDLYQQAAPNGDGTQNARGISANCKNPDRAMDFFNYLDSDEGCRLINNGVKGVHWDYVDGVPQMTPDVFDAFVGFQPDLWTELWDGGFQILWPYCSGRNTAPAWKCEDGYASDLRSTVWYRQRNASLNPGIVLAAKTLGYEGLYLGQIYEHWVEDGIAKSPVKYKDLGSMMPPLFDEALSQTAVQTNEYIFAKLGDIILAKDKASFDETRDRVIAELKVMGGQELVDWLYNSYLTIYDANDWK